MTALVTMIQGADLPDLALTWKDRSGNLIDFSSGWTFSVKVGVVAGTALITKTTNITGAATAPNLTISWATSEVGTLAAGSYVVEIIATETSDSRERKAKVSLVIDKALS